MPDLNLLVALDVLLAEGNVARAAKRLHLSASAMSRTLARLRDATGDPLLVKAGRGLVPTPRAQELRARVGPLVLDATAALRPEQAPKLERLARTFTLRTGDGFVENFGAALVERVVREAPGVRLRFVQKPEKDNAPLLSGAVDLETGVVGRSAAADLHAQALFEDRFVGVVAASHPLARGRITVERYAACRHVLVSRRDAEKGPFDAALDAAGIARNVAVVVGGFAAALALARASDFVASVPERHTGNLRAGMRTFALPFEVPAFTVSMLWHPRLHADPVHRWLRSCVREACTMMVDTHEAP